MKKIIAGLLAYLLTVTPVLAQATLVPNAKQTFVNSTGVPLAGGSVTMYVPNTTTKKTTWRDATQLINNQNPLTLDSAGRAVIFGQGNYRQIVKDSVGNTIWDSFTSATGSSQPSGATGTDTAPVGTIMPFAGFTLPTNWQLTYGQAVSRTTFSDLKTAITVTATVGCVSTSTTLSGFTDTSVLRIGAPVEASCIPTGTVIVSLASATAVVVNNAAVSTGSVSAVVFPWGNGDGVATFNVPNLKGITLVGANAMGGTASTNLARSTTISTTSGSPTATVASATGLFAGMTVVSTNVPAGTTISAIVSTTVTLSANASATVSGTAATFLAFSSANAPAASGGSAARSQLLSEMVAHTPSGTIAQITPAGTIAQVTPTGVNASSTVSGGTSYLQNGVGPGGVGAGANATTGTLTADAQIWTGTPFTPVFTGTPFTPVFTGTTIGSGSPASTLQPSATIYYMIKMAPNSTGAGGVVSLGGMFGDIVCGAGVDCSSQTISFSGSGTGTVTSVGLSLPSIFSVSGSPVTVSGTLSATLATQTANTLFVGPTTGAAATPTFRAMVSADLPTSPVISGHPTIEGVTSTGATGTGALVFSASPSLTGVLTVTNPASSALNIRSGASGSFADICLGRTSCEFDIGVAAASNQFMPGTLAGDAAFKATQAMFFAVSGGATRAGAIDPNGQWLFGATASSVTTDALHVISRNTAALPLHDPALTADEWWLTQWGVQDGKNGGFGIDTFGGFGVMDFRRANGTNASKTALLSGNLMGVVGALGYTGSSYSAGAAQVRWTATENWSGSAQGAKVSVHTTPNGATAASSFSETASFHTSGNVFSTNGTTFVSTLPALDAGTVAGFYGANASSAQISLSAFGTSVFPSFIAKAARGTAASPSQTNSADILGIFSAEGYTNSSAYTFGVGQLRFVAAESFTSSAQGAHAEIWTTSVGSTTTARVARWWASGGVSIGTIASDPTTGVLTVANGIKAASINFGGSSLSSYVEGSWTPALSTDATPGTPAYTTQYGSYERIGRQVTAYFQIVASGWTGSPTGNVVVTGLPLTSSGTSGEAGVCVMSSYTVTGLAASNIGVTGNILGSSTTILLRQANSTGTIAITAAQAGSTPVLSGSCTYRV